MDAEITHIDNRYQILAEIGSGGMGYVLRAIDRLTGEYVAVKRVNVRQGVLAGSHSDELRIALAREFQASAALRHPQIVRVFDYGFDDDLHPYLAMELLDRPQDILRASADKSPIEKLKLLVQTLHAVLYLHRRGVLHRDLKPANILVVDGSVKLVDFGLATAKSQVSDFAGTFGYMSPELLKGSQPTESSDLYSIGVVAYEMMIGRHPFDISNKPFFEAIDHVAQTQPDMAPLLELQARGIFNAPSLPPLDAPTTADSDDRATVMLPPVDPQQAPTIVSVGEPTYLGEQPPTSDVASLHASDAPLPVPDTSTVPGIIMRLLHTSPEHRYNDAAEVIRDLSAAIGEALPVETPETRESFLQAAQFIGREAEFDRLNEAMHQALTGHGSAWYVSGESGVGKTRLFDEIRIRALIEGALVVRGYAPEAAVAYQVWREPLKRMILNVEVSDADAAVLRDVIPDIEALLNRKLETAPQVEPSEVQSRIARVVTALLRAQPRPVVLILEDIHWMTTESVELLDAVQQLAPGLPLLVLANFRSDEHTHLLGPLLENGNLIRLPRLNASEIAALSESMIGQRGDQPQIVDFLVRETEGNIYFVIEVMRALAEDAGQLEQISGSSLPVRVFAGGIRKVVENRLARVPARAEPLLRTAAVLGRVIDLQVLRQAKPGLNLDDWLYDVSRVAVIETRDGQWQFAHDKLRQGIIERLNADETSDVHREAAQAIEVAYPGLPQYAGALAIHWGAAGDFDREAEYRQQAGRYDYQIGQYDAAAAHYRRAIELLRRDEITNQRAIGALLAELAKIQLRAGGDAEGAQSLLESADEIARQTGDRKLAAEIHLQRGRFALAAGDIQTAEQDLTTALMLFQELTEQSGAADTMTTLAEIYLMSGAFDQAEPLLTRTLETYRSLGQVRGVAHAYFSLGRLAAMKGDLVQAEAYLNDSLTLSKALGMPNREAAVLMQLGMVSHFQGRTDEARQQLDAALKRFEDAGDQPGLANCINNLGFVALSSNALDEAQQHFERSLLLSEKIGDLWGVANTLANIGHVKLQRGLIGQAVASYRDALEGATAIGAVEVIMEVLVALAGHIRSGDESLALDMIDIALYHPASSPDVVEQAQQFRAEAFPDRAARPDIPLDPPSIQARIADVLAHLSDEKTADGES